MQILDDGIYLTFPSLFFTYYRLFSTLQSVFQLAHLRSVSIGYNQAHYHQNYTKLLCTQILAEINGLNAKGTLEVVDSFDNRNKIFLKLNLMPSDGWDLHKNLNKMNFRL